MRELGSESRAGFNSLLAEEAMSQGRSPHPNRSQSERGSSPMPATASSSGGGWGCSWRCSMRLIELEAQLQQQRALHADLGQRAAASEALQRHQLDASEAVVTELRTQVGQSDTGNAGGPC